MDKVNEKAWLLYPDKKVVLARGNTCLSCGKVKREAYLEGYYQAQKDLALTWEDINRIEIIIKDVYRDYPHGIEAKQFGIEVLNRYNN